MRQIKFRGMRTSDGKWLFGDFYYSAINEPCVDEWTVLLATVGQYTGLKDKNGVEIYEGDVVRVNCGDVARNGFGEVEWRPAGCCFGINGFLDEYPIPRDLYHPRQKGELYFDLQKWLALEVIGNIHDNRELLHA